MGHWEREEETEREREGEGQLLECVDRQFEYGKRKFWGCRLDENTLVSVFVRVEIDILPSIPLHASQRKEYLCCQKNKK